jgi:hypothetical protein
MTKYGDKRSASANKIVYGMISIVQSYTNPVIPHAWITPSQQWLPQLSCTNASLYNSICMLVKTLRSDCIGNTVLAIATLWRESTYITCRANPYWQVTDSLSYRNVNYFNYFNCLSGLSTVMTVHSTKNKKTGNVRTELTLRSVRVTIVAVANRGK